MGWYVTSQVLLTPSCPPRHNSPQVWCTVRVMHFRPKTLCLHLCSRSVYSQSLLVVSICLGDGAGLEVVSNPQPYIDRVMPLHLPLLSFTWAVWASNASILFRVDVHLFSIYCQLVCTVCVLDVRLRACCSFLRLGVGARMRGVIPLHASRRVPLVAGSTYFFWFSVLVCCCSTSPSRVLVTCA